MSNWQRNGKQQVKQEDYEEKLRKLKYFMVGKRLRKLALTSTGVSSSIRMSDSNNIYKTMKHVKKEEQVVDRGFETRNVVIDEQYRTTIQLRTEKEKEEEAEYKWFRSIDWDLYMPNSMSCTRSPPKVPEEFVASSFEMNNVIANVEDKRAMELRVAEEEEDEWFRSIDWSLYSPSRISSNGNPTRIEEGVQRDVDTGNMVIDEEDDDQWFASIDWDLYFPTYVSCTSAPTYLNYIK